MIRLTRIFAPGLAALLAVLAANGAFAVSNLRVEATGKEPGLSRLSLFNTAGQEIASGTGSLSANKIPAGTYALRTQTGSQSPKTTELRLEDDKTCSYRVNTDTGDAELLRCIGFLATQQQQQEPWSFGVLAGVKDTPFDARVSSSFGASGDVDLGETGGNLGFEFRRHLRTPRIGEGTFFYAGYDQYFGTEARRIDLNFHFGLPNDSGARVKEKFSLRFGVGQSWKLSEAVSLELMAGAHCTRVRGSVISDENEGGGQYNEFSRSKYLWGPSASIGATFPLFKREGSNRPVRGLLRYTANWIGDLDVSGTSAFAFQYDGHIDGGRQDQWQLGLVAPF